MSDPRELGDGLEATVEPGDVMSNQEIEAFAMRQGSNQHSVQDAVRWLHGWHARDDAQRGTQRRIERFHEWADDIERLEEQYEVACRERDAARLVPPLIRGTLEKALRLDKTKPPVTQAELRAAIDLLPDSPSFYSSVQGIERIAELQEQLETSQQDRGALWRLVGEERERIQRLLKQYQTALDRLWEAHDQLCGCDRPADEGTCSAPEETWGAFEYLGQRERDAFPASGSDS